MPLTTERMEVGLERGGGGGVDSAPPLLPLPGAPSSCPPTLLLLGGSMTDAPGTMVGELVAEGEERCTPAPAPVDTASDSANTCTVDLSEDTASQSQPRDSAMEWMMAWSAPRLSSCSSCPSAVFHTRTSVPLSLALASRLPHSDSDSADSALLCALMNLVWRRSYSSTRICPVCRPGHASTVDSAVEETATRPLGFARVSIWCSSLRSAKLYTRTLCSKATTMRSLRSLTARTWLRKLSSPMHLPWWSSQIMTLVGGYLGAAPPPTIARMLQRNNISTIPMPPGPPSNPRQNDSL
mmetsp:Transcript_24392/g.62012  ORF Transcript_24392/g.62012 Transcript_24392/m.62012 type:complete len:296 (-) Transcript_24392:237-1124(-)